MTELEIRTKKIKLFNYILIGLMVTSLFILLPLILESGGEDDTSALIAIPVVIIGCGIISILTFELVDLQINRGFYQIKAMFNSAIIIIASLIFLIAVGEDIFSDGLVFLFIIIIMCGLAIYHWKLARQDLISNHPKVNAKLAMLTTIALAFVIPGLSFLVFLIISIFR